MTLISLSMPFEGRLFIAILNMAVCAVLFSIRVYHWRIKEREDWKLNAAGLSSILVALLYCSFVVTSEIRAQLGDTWWCHLSMKLISVTYVIHRILIYLFIILRLEVVIQSTSFRIIDTGKVIIVVSGIFMVVATMVFSRGIPDQNLNCWFESAEEILAIMYIIDILICVSGTWMFIQPLRLYVRHIDDMNVRYMLRKTQIWSIVCLVSTLLVMFTIVVIDGGGVLIAFDCSITSLGLVMMMSPVTHEVLTESNLPSSPGEIVELGAITNVSPKRELSGLKISYGLKRPSSKYEFSSELFTDMLFLSSPSST